MSRMLNEVCVCVFVDTLFSPCEVKIIYLKMMTVLVLILILIDASEMCSHLCHVRVHVCMHNCQHSNSW